MISFIRIAADLGDRRPVSRRLATLRETPWLRHRQIYPFRRWAGEAQACPARTAQVGGYRRVGVRRMANRTVDLDGEVGTAPGLKALGAALQALAELLDLGCADPGMTTDLGPPHLSNYQPTDPIGQELPHGQRVLKRDPATDSMPRNCNDGRRHPEPEAFPWDQVLDALG